MKTVKRGIVSLTVLLMFLLSTIFIYKTMVQVVALTTATISVDPSTSMVPVGQDFTIEINISNVADLYGWEFRLNWAATILDAKNVSEGPFLKQGGSTFFTFEINNTEGYVLVDCTLMGEVPGVDGNGILATVEFYVKAAGESVLNLYDTILIGSQEQYIIHQLIDGYGYFLPHDVTVIGIAAWPITVLPGQLVYINVTVENQGGYGENFNVTTNYDSVLIEKQLVSLNQGQRIVLNFTWDTTGVGKGDYKILAEASEVPGEIDTTDNTKIADSIITILSLGHDVAVKAVIPSKTVVGQGYSLFINITAKNYGSFTETFNVTAYHNETAIILPNGKNYTSITLSSGNSTTIIFAWNTTGFAKGNYTISAYAWPVLGETDTTDNTRTADSQVKVGIPGDLNDDNLCDLLDLVKVAGKFGKVLGEPGYDPDYDINDDTTIDLLDLVKVAIHFGETDP